ncbi:MAG: amidohydrolase [Streptosporangiaceae bacterium]|nr:amidohydrolase [Streptosporangiaceae bacterium]
MIAALGSDDEIRELAGPRTRAVDLGGRLALPAFGDAHVHAVSGGLESLRCNLLGLRARQDCLAAVAAYSAGLAADAWVLGGGWAMEAFPGGTPTAADLDSVTGGRPAFIPNRDHHSAWVNTAALQRAGLDASTPDPPDGRIERDAAGYPCGTLHDGAMRLVAAHVPPATDAELTAGLLAAQAYLHSLGITSFTDACVGQAGELGIPDAFGAYRRAAADGLLTCRVTGALWWDRTRGMAQLEDLLTRRGQAGTGRFRATSVKLMLDGVCETFTAAMSAPYLDGHGHPTSHSGKLFIEPEELREATGRLAAAGFQLHFHALGDLAVTAALDVLEALPARQRRAGRHHLAHLQFIAPGDMDRFAALGAVANFQPLWACCDPQMERLTLPFVGPERAAWQYQIGSLARRGTRIAFGSDWPVSTPDPLQEMHVAVNRVLSARQGQPGTPECERPLLPGQAITLEAAIGAFTSGVAYVNHDDVAGRLLPGMRADVAVLDQDLYSVPAADIGGTSVVMTIANGTVVFGDE